ncbi:MAG: hypothetical protein KGR26_00410 [Cyanobacteria bacterium REEB65]|nr:hypothetical protein [Cyanobacteria bacterium REEB65]
MRISKMLDAAYPASTAAAWVADLNAAGAEVAAVYLPAYGGGGTGHYTAQYVQAALDAGKTVMAVTVPGSAPPALSVITDAAASIGIKPGPLAFDVAIGDNNFSSWSWLAQAEAQAETEGWQPWSYLQPSIRSYAPAGLFWSTDPVSTVPNYLPSGWDAWQYSGFVGPSGANYDISLINLDQLPQRRRRTVFIFQDATTGNVTFEADGIVAHIAIPADIPEVQAAAADPTHVAKLSDATFNNFVQAANSRAAGAGLNLAQQAQLSDIQAKIDADLK